MAQKPLPAYQPNPAELSASYRRMALMDSLTRGSVLKTQVTPNWLPDGQSFWYRNVLKDSLIEYLVVKPGENKRTPAFDNARVAAALSKAYDSTFSAARLWISDIHFEPDKHRLILQSKGKWFAYDTETGTAQKIAKPDLPKTKDTGWTRQTSRWGRFRADSVS
ncbi:MAG TPA: hypothetical protein VGE06_08025, partial [Flavisolibacter sp.]